MLPSITFKIFEQDGQMIDLRMSLAREGDDTMMELKVT